MLTGTLGGSSDGLYAQGWARTYGQSNHEQANAVWETTTGGFIVAGETRSFGASSDDAWVLKLDAFGTVLWEKRFAGPNTDSAYSVAEIQGGNFVVAGYRQAPTIDNDLWIVMLDPSGAILYEKTYGLLGNESALSVQPTSSGGFVVAGYTSSYGSTPYDIWVLVFDAACNVLWQKTYGGAGDDRGYFAQEKSGGAGFVVVGTTRSFGAGDTDFWALNLDSAGNIIWQKTYGGTGRDDATPVNKSRMSAQQASDGGFVLAGYTESFGAVAGDLWVLKLDATGAIQWENRYDGTMTDGGYDVMEVPGGGYVVAGTTEIGFLFSFWGLKLGPSGTVVWQKNYGSMSDTGLAVHVIGSGAAVLGGGTATYSAGQSDAYLLKVDQNGEINPSCPFGNTSASAASTSATVTNTTVTGVTSADPGTNLSSSAVTTSAVVGTVCSGPTITQGSSYCIAGLSTGAAYAWFLDLNLNSIINSGEPVETSVTNTVPAGQNGPLLAAAFVASINADPDVQIAKVSASVTTPPSCFTVTRAASCAGGVTPGAACLLDADCGVGGVCALPPVPELYVGPPGSPTSCHVTAGGCSYNPTITKVDLTGESAAIPTLEGWGIAASVILLLMSATALILRRSREPTRTT